MQKDIVIIYFDRFLINLQERLIEHNLPHKILNIDHLEKYHKVPDVLFITGSKRRILQINHYPVLQELIKKVKIVIGFCYGFQLLAYFNGGHIIQSTHHHEKRKKVVIGKNTYKMFFNHYDRVIQLPKEWKVYHTIDNFINIANYKNLWGFQFHPEKSNENFKTFIIPLISNIKHS